jgi:transcriptional regulator with GAF, ATPase, and Fis domain
MPLRAHGGFCLDDHLLGRDRAMLALKREIRLLAESPFPVLIEGETGTGKELVARALHVLSGRRGQLVPVNVASLQEQLADAELFGAEKGAYTGADRRRPGLVEMAERGSLLLDEAGELSAAVQVKLLRVLEDGVARPVGGGPSQTVDFRLLVTTQYPASSLFRDRRWRPDFFCRVAGLRLRVPPLRERRGDVALLAETFARQHGAIRWGMGCLEELQRHDWPGNVRQLLHVVQRLGLERRSGTLDLVTVRNVLREESSLWSVPSASLPSNPAAVSFDRDPRVIREVLARTSCYAEAARELGISLRTLHRRLAELGLRPGGMPDARPR